MNRNKAELAIVALLTVIAGILRVYRIVELPDGLHGDEALTGIDAMRILQEGWIGPYVSSGLGQPTGPLYFTALVFLLSKPSLFTLHLSMALLGVATIPASYFLFRISFGRWVAMFSTVALTVSYWHIFFSRSAFMLISMPLMTTLAAAAILLAFRSRTRWAWFVAGVFLGLGVYSYNGYLAFLAVAAVLLTIFLVLGRDRIRFYASGAVALAVGFVIAAFPLLHLAYSDPEFYFQRHRAVSVLQAPEYQEAETVVAKLSYLTDRAWKAATLPLRHSSIDFGDGFGGRGAMNPIIGLLAYVGLGIALVRWRSPPHLLMAVAFIAGLSVSVAIVGWENRGDLRRTLIVVPFVYGLAGVAMVAWAKWAIGLAGRARERVAVYAIVAVILMVAATMNTWTYFGRMVHQEDMDWIYAVDLVDALDAVHQLADPGTVYFYSDRWSYDYEARRFLYPDTSGLDRSKRFGDYSLERLHYGPVTYALLHTYSGDINTLKALYPNGLARTGHDATGNIRFSIFHLP